MRKSKEKIYAIYKGDQFVTVGTVKECAEDLKLKEATIKWMSSPACHKRDVQEDRMVAYKVEE